MVSVGRGNEVARSRPSDTVRVGRSWGIEEERKDDREKVKT